MGVSLDSFVPLTVTNASTTCSPTTCQTRRLVDFAADSMTRAVASEAIFWSRYFGVVSPVGLWIFEKLARPWYPESRVTAGRGWMDPFIEQGNGYRPHFVAHV